MARYKMPGARINCVFCPEVRVTAEQFFTVLGNYLQ